VRSKNEPDSYEDWCQHYASMAGVEGLNGTGTWKDGHCRAGVRHGDVCQAIPGAKSNLELMPCFKRNKLPCPKQRFNTPEEAAAQRAEADESIKEWLGKLANNICPECDTPVKKQRQVGRCVYADPCGHRLFQGRAKGTSERRYEEISMEF